MSMAAEESARKLHHKQRQAAKLRYGCDGPLYLSDRPDRDTMPIAILEDIKDII